MSSSFFYILLFNNLKCTEPLCGWGLFYMKNTLCLDRGRTKFFPTFFMASFIGFKIEVPKRNIPQYYRKAYNVIKILEGIGYNNSNKLNGNLSRSVTYLISVHEDIYKYISDNYPSKESYILTSGLGTLNYFYTIKCVLSASISNTNFGDDLYSKVLVLNTTSVLNIHKLLL